MKLSPVLYLALTLSLLSPAPSALAALTPFLVQEGVEKAVHSKVTSVVSIRLPDGGFRSTAKDDNETLRQALIKFAQVSPGKLGAVEVLVWPAEAQPIQKLNTCLKEAGYSYLARPSVDAEPGRITPLAAVRRDKKDDLVGMWIETSNKMVLLVWGVASSESPTNKPTPPAVAPAGATPEALLGDWSWTTISTVGYQDRTTGRLAEPSGMSAQFSFLAGGRYKMVFYVRQRLYNLPSESTTTEEGIVVFGAEGTFTLQPERGYYKGNSAGKPIDRPMSESERKQHTYLWEWRENNGKRQLYIGPNKSSMSPFKRP